MVVVAYERICIFPAKLHKVAYWSAEFVSYFLNIRYTNTVLLTIVFVKLI